MMAIAAILISTATLKKLQPILNEYKKIPAKSSLNSLVTDKHTKRGIRVACANPGDKAAMNTFFKQHFGTEGSLYLVASGKPGMDSEWEHWKLNLSSRQVCYMLEAEPDNTQTLIPSKLFSTLEEAWQQALHLAKDNDTVLLLTQGHAARKQFFTYRQEQSFMPQCMNKSPLWSADTLAELFKGTWINGRKFGWGVDRIGWGKSMVGSNMITILPGSYPEKSENIAPMEAAVEKVIQTGAYAAVSAVISNKLPRWKPLMQTDDPYGGLLRLAEYARQRLQGLVISLSTDSDNMQLLLNLIRNYLSNSSNLDVCISNTKSDESLDQVTAVALALANTRPELLLNIFPWESDNPFIGQILRPDIVVIDGTCPILHKPQKLFSSLKKETVIFALIEPEQEDHWHMVDQKSPMQIHLIISSTKDNNKTLDWERMSAAILEHVIRINQKKETN